MKAIICSGPTSTWKQPSLRLVSIIEKPVLGLPPLWQCFQAHRLVT